VRYVIPYPIERVHPAACSHVRPRVERRRFRPAYACPLLISSDWLYGTGGRNCDCLGSAGAGDTQEGGVGSNGLALEAGVIAAGVDTGGLSNGTTSSPAAERAALPAPAYSFVRVLATVA
jgi:hypothetical protein